MTVRMLGAAAVFVGAAFFAATAQAAGADQSAGDPVQGKIKSQTCLGCHGIAGYTTVYPTYPVPRLAGQHAEYIVAALKSYAAGKRDFATMHAQATALSEADMRDVAAYFESLGADFEPESVKKKTNESKLGKLVQTCAACHGPTGVSTVAQFPIIAGQYKGYLGYALHAYKNGKRENTIMKGMVSGLNAEEIEALAGYFSAQKSPLHVLPRPSPPID